MKEGHFETKTQDILGKAICRRHYWDFLVVSFSSVREFEKF